MAQVRQWQAHLNTVITTFTIPDQIGAGITYHKIVWDLLGTASAATIKLQGSNDNSTWSDVITGTATSDGTSVQTAGTYTYYRLNLSTFTPSSQGAYVVVNYFGYTAADVTSSFTEAVLVTASSATALVVGPNGVTDPTFKVVTNVASAATGLSITGNAAESGVTLTALSSGSNESIFVIPKGNGKFTIGTSTFNNSNQVMLSVGNGGTAIAAPVIFAIDAPSGTDSNAQIIMARGSVQQGIFGVAGGANSVIDGSAANDFVIRSQGGKIMFSADSGNTPQLVLLTTGVFGFGTLGSAVLDNGLTRNAAGVIEVNSGTAGTLRDLKARGLAAAGDNSGIASTTGLTNVTDTTLTNAYIVKGGQAATTANTGWIKIYIGTTPAWVPYWANATP